MSAENSEQKTDAELPKIEEVEEQTTEEPKQDETKTNGDETAEVGAPSDQESPKTKKPNVFKRFFKAIKQNRKTQIIAGLVLAFIALIFAFPVTRYAVLSPFFKQSLILHLADARTTKPVSEAEVSISGHSAKTDVEGNVSFDNIPVGKRIAHITKKYYKDGNISFVVKLRKRPGGFHAQLEATGRQVEISVTNKITQKPLTNAVVKALDTNTRTDKSGKATLVLPADKDSAEGSISLDGFITAKVSIRVVDGAAKENNFLIVPSGKLYFLSKKSGKIDVVKTNLDGSERQTVLAGTGKEDDRETVLLASRDWKYLALQSRRDSTLPKLYLIDTADDKLTTMDEGDATFTVSGWSEHRFIYSVNRNIFDAWKPKQTAIKSYNAEKKQIIVLDETGAEGTGLFDYAKEYFGEVYAISTDVIYAKNWTANYYASGRLNDKKASIVKIQNDGTHKTILNSLGIPSGTTATTLAYESRPYEASSIYFKFDLGNNLFKYKDGQASSTTEIKPEDFYEQYPTYLVSPNGNDTFWSEARDGKNTLFIGDKDGDNGKEVAVLSELTQYGWYTDDYLLVSKGGSELYIFGRDGLKDTGQSPYKVTDYHKPSQSFRGYGGGYGGY